MHAIDPCRMNLYQCPLPCYSGQTLQTEEENISLITSVEYKNQIVLLFQNIDSKQALQTQF